MPTVVVMSAILPRGYDNSVDSPAPAGWNGPVRIVAITPDFAAAMTTWRYPEPYGVYSLTGMDPAFFLDPANGYVALVDDAGTLIGYRCFGPDGRVPGFDYDDSALDTGGGLRPDLTGAGRGAAAIATGLAYGRERFRADAFRVTVAAFNVRARRVVESLGFRPVARFRAATAGAEYDVLRVAADDLRLDVALRAPGADPAARRRLDDIAADHRAG
jgi:[ribosomal protein S18]-alanine N-acetyltransferase